MMPSARQGRNRTAPASGILAVAFALCACSGAPEMQIALIAALEPDPFDGVRTLRVVAATPVGPLTLAQTRWDQGPVALERGLPLSARRVWVEGLDDDGLVVSFAASAPLDLLERPRERLELVFARVGTFSRLELRVEPRRGWQAVELEGAGVLLFGGTDPAGRLPEATWLVDLDGRLRPGPPLPGGRVGAAVAALGPRVVVWGGRSEAGPASEFVVLEPGAEPRSGPNPISPGPSPRVVPSDRRRVLVVDTASAEVGEIDLADGGGRRVGRLDAALPGGAVARWSAGRLVLVGGEGLASAALYDARTSGLVGSALGLDGDRIGGAALTTSAGSTVVVGGVEADGRPSDGALTLRWAISPTDTATSSFFVTGAAPGPLRLVDAGGGELLGLPEDEAAPGLALDLLGGQIRSLGTGFGALGLARHVDGSLLGVSPDGQLLAYRPGPQILVPSLDDGLGLVPRRPEGWRREGQGVVGRAPRSALPGSLDPAAWATLGDGIYEDFALELDVTRVGRGRAGLLFGFDGESYDVVVLERSARVRAGPGRERVGCPAADVEGLDEGSGTVRVRLERRGAQIRLDVGADGRAEFDCTLTRSNPGRLALAVLQGEVRFSNLRWLGPLAVR